MILFCNTAYSGTEILYVMNVQHMFMCTCMHYMHIQLEVCVTGSGVVVPVYLEQEEVDLYMCLPDRLYQCSIRLHNRYDSRIEHVCECICMYLAFMCAYMLAWLP